MRDIARIHDRAVDQLRDFLQVIRLDDAMVFQSQRGGAGKKADRS